MIARCYCCDEQPAMLLTDYRGGVEHPLLPDPEAPTAKTLRQTAEFRCPRCGVHITVEAIAMLVCTIVLEPQLPEGVAFL